MSQKKRTRRRVTFMTTDKFIKLTNKALPDILTDEQIIATFDSIFCLQNAIFSSFLDIEKALADKTLLNKKLLSLQRNETDSIEALLSSPSSIELISDLEKAYNQTQATFAIIGEYKINLNINEIANSTTKASKEPIHDITININTDDNNLPKEQEKKRRKKKRKNVKRKTTTLEMELRPINKRKSRAKKTFLYINEDINNESKEKSRRASKKRPSSAGNNTKEWEKEEKIHEKRKRKRARRKKRENDELFRKRKSASVVEKTRNKKKRLMRDDDKNWSKIYEKREEIKRIKAKRKKQMSSDNLWKLRNEYKKKTDKTFKNVHEQKRSSLIVKADASKWDRNWDIINKQRVEIRKLKEKRKREKQEKEEKEKRMALNKRVSFRGHPHDS